MRRGPVRRRAGTDPGRAVSSPPSHPASARRVVRRAIRRRSRCLRRIAGVEQVEARRAVGLHRSSRPRNHGPGLPSVTIVLRSRGRTREARRTVVRRGLRPGRPCEQAEIGARRRSASPSSAIPSAHRSRSRLATTRAAWRKTGAGTGAGNSGGNRPADPPAGPGFGPGGRADAGSALLQPCTFHSVRGIVTTIRGLRRGATRVGTGTGRVTRGGTRGGTVAAMRTGIAARGAGSTTRIRGAVPR